MGFVRKLQEATDVDCSFLYPVLSEIDSGRRLLQITVRKTLVSKGRILRKKCFFFLSLQESIISERFLHLGKMPNDWKIANMPGKDGDVGNTG